jgi:hypothetical protein
MAYGTANVDVIQSSTANTPVQFNDGNGTQIGTLCRAWVNFNGSTSTIRASFNVSSVTRTSTGNFTINFTNALPDTNYAPTGTNRSPGVTSGSAMQFETYTTTTLAFTTVSAAGAAYDPTQVSVIIHR